MCRVCIGEELTSVWVNLLERTSAMSRCACIILGIIYMDCEMLRCQTKYSLHNFKCPCTCDVHMHIIVQ